MALHPVPRLRHRAVAEVVGPSPHRAVQGAHDLLPRRLVAGPQSSTNLVPNRGHGFLRGACTVIASAGSRRVHGSEGVPEKIEGLASSVAHPRLGLVQREPDAGHPSPSRVENLAGPVPTEDHESSSAGESHPRALPEPYVRLSPHTAPTIQPPASRRAATGQKASGPVAQCAPASAWTHVLDVETV